MRKCTLALRFATALVIPLRVLRELLEVLVVPLLMLLVWPPWIQAGAWHAHEVRVNGTSTAPSLAYLFTAVLGLLLLFKFVLRPGIRFY